ncbi:MAG TPA: Uma2 family endonuclease [Nitrospiria bacterium]|nr:Uma2 family endonuclease [Nitrospiria bacterium]
MKEQARQAIRFTYEDYLHFPDDRKQYQIVDGEVYMVPAPIPYHQRVSMNIGIMVHSYVSRHGLGEVFYSPCDVLLSNENVVQPDIFFISKNQLNIITEKNIAGPPDLVIEILSPYTEKLDRTIKKELYSKYGVQEYWLVDPASKGIELLALSDNKLSTIGIFGVKDTFGSKVIKGLSVNIEKVFQGIG